MAYGALTAFLGKHHINPSQVIMTAVLPGGCPLACPTCIIKQRDERSETACYSPEHLTSLMMAIHSRGALGGAAIVGDEPLQPTAWLYAQPFLEQANRLKIPSAIITSGYYLEDYLDQLHALKNTKILVSLDGIGTSHDKIRGKQGAFARIEKGFTEAQKYPDLLERMSIAAILMPGNLDEISNIIKFAADAGLPRLILSPLLQSSRSTALRVQPKVLESAWKEVPSLMSYAGSMGVKLFVSDEFGILGPWEQKLINTGIDILVPRFSANLFRIDALGRIETLDSMRAGTPTDLQMPNDINEIESLADNLIGHFRVQSLAA